METPLARGIKVANVSGHSMELANVQLPSQNGTAYAPVAVSGFYEVRIYLDSVSDECFI